MCLIVIGFNIPNILKMIKGDESESSGENILIVDSENVFEGTLGALNEMDLGYKFDVSNDKLKFEECRELIDEYLYAGCSLKTPVVLSNKGE